MRKEANVWRGIAAFCFFCHFCRFPPPSAAFCRFPVLPAAFRCFLPLFYRPKAILTPNRKRSADIA